MHYCKFGLDSLSDIKLGSFRYRRRCLYPNRKEICAYKWWVLIVECFAWCASIEYLCAYNFWVLYAISVYALINDMRLLMNTAYIWDFMIIYFILYSLLKCILSLKTHWNWNRHSMTVKDVNYLGIFYASKHQEAQTLQITLTSGLKYKDLRYRVLFLVMWRNWHKSWHAKLYMIPISCPCMHSFDIHLLMNGPHTSHRKLWMVKIMYLIIGHVSLSNESFSLIW